MPTEVAYCADTDGVLRVHKQRDNRAVTPRVFGSSPQPADAGSFWTRL